MWVSGRGSVAEAPAEVPWQGFRGRGSVTARPPRMRHFGGNWKSACPTGAWLRRSVLEMPCPQGSRYPCGALRHPALPPPTSHAPAHVPLPLR